MEKVIPVHIALVYIPKPVHMAVILEISCDLLDLLLFVFSVKLGLALLDQVFFNLIEIFVHI